MLDISKRHNRTLVIGEHMMDVEYLRSALHYDAATGVFTWKVSRGPIKVGDVAGTPSVRGYLVIRVDYKLYTAHRLAWFYMTGKWPEHEVDHKDLDRANNAWDNLRPATHAQNQRNMSAQKNNKLGVKGVGLFLGKYKAQIRYKGKQIHLGCYATLEEAKAAYEEAANIAAGEFARTE